MTPAPKSPPKRAARRKKRKSLRFYSVAFGADVRAYAQGEIEAATIESAIAIAKRRFHELWWKFDGDVVDYSGPRHPTLIDVTDGEAGKTYHIGEDFYVDDQDRIEAAASDLLAALRELLVSDELSADPNNLSRSASRAIEQARSAIAKTTGGAA